MHTKNMHIKESENSMQIKHSENDLETMEAREKERVCVTGSSSE